MFRDRFELGTETEVSSWQLSVADGGRLLPPAKESNVELLQDAQRVVEFDAQVSDRAVHLGMTK